MYFKYQATGESLRRHHSTKLIYQSAPGVDKVWESNAFTLDWSKVQPVQVEKINVVQLITKSIFLLFLLFFLSVCIHCTFLHFRSSLTILVFILCPRTSQQVWFVDKAGGIEVFEAKEQKQYGRNNLGGNALQHRRPAWQLYEHTKADDTHLTVMEPGE